MLNRRGHAAVDRRSGSGAPDLVLVLLLCLALLLALAVGRGVAGEGALLAEAASADPFPPPLAPPLEEIVPPGSEAGPGLTLKSAPTATFEERVVELVNQERWDAGQLPPLKQVAALDASSETHSFNMADRDFFAHCDLDTKTLPSQRAQNAGYTAPVAENIAAGYATPEDVMAAWMASQGHKGNILSGAREIGVGYILQGDDQATVRQDFNGDCDGDDVVDGIPESGHGPYFRYWTQNFGARSGVYPLVIEREAHATGSTTVDLYLYGEGWAQEMRFSDDGCTWSAWEPYQTDTVWTLPAGGGTRTVRAQLRNGSTVLESRDSIVVDAACAASQELDLGAPGVDTCQVYEACDTITAGDGFQVEATGDVTFRAGRRIVLGDGFSVASGGSFRAVVDPAL